MTHHGNQRGRPWFDDLADFGRFRDALARADYTEQGVAEALGLKNVRSVAGQDLPLLLHLTRQATPLNTLIRLFLIDAPVPIDAAQQALAPLSVAALARAGVVTIEGEAVTTALRLLPLESLLLAFDLPRRLQAGGSADYVMGIGSSSLTLANLTVRRPAEAVLDLGTGCGFQAFLAARHGARVLAVDCNPRAVQIASFNTQLNALMNVECLEGNYFEPVAGRAFDLVVSNPPFVISPERRYIYRDSGMTGDEITRTLVRQVPPFLREGGYCQILCNWAHLAGGDWPSRLAGWFEGTGCDAWVMRTDTLEAAAYAAKWICHTERDDPEQFSRRFEQWTAYYRRERIEAVSGGLITMRRRHAAAHWFRADDGPANMRGPAGDAIHRGFVLRDFLETMHDDQSLIEQRLRLSPDARLRQAFEPGVQDWSLSECELHLVRGLTYAGDVDPYIARFLAQCDGRRPLGELMGDLAASLGKSTADVVPACLGVVRRLVERGFLLPPMDAP